MSHEKQFKEFYKNKANKYGSNGDTMAFAHFINNNFWIPMTDWKTKEPWRMLQKLDLLKASTASWSRPAI